MNETHSMMIKHFKFLIVCLGLFSGVFGFNANNTDLGLLAGAGIEYKVTDTIRPVVELKYDAWGFGQFVFDIGVIYIFEEY